MQTLSTRLILEVGQAILAADGLESTVAIILDAVHRLAGAETAVLVQIEAPGGTLRCTHAAGLDVADLTALPPPRIGDGVVGRAIAEGRTIWTPDILNDPSVHLPPDLRQAMERLGFRSVMAAPLLVNGAARGALACHNRVPESFSEAEVDVLSALASLAGVALENVRLQEETRVQAHRAQVVADMARIVSSTLDMPALLRALLREIQRIIPCTLGSFGYYEPATHTIVNAMMKSRLYGSCTPASTSMPPDNQLGATTAVRSPNQNRAA